MTGEGTFGLEPGDLMAYGVSGVLSYIKYPFEHLVQLRTMSSVYHVEVYVGGGLSISADYRGVNEFPTNFDPERLYAILRPKVPVDVAAGLSWFDKNARGQFYDVWGLIAFGNSHDPKKKICSEIATLFYRNSGLPMLMNGLDAKIVRPDMLLISGWFRTLYKRKS